MRRTVSRAMSAPPTIDRLQLVGRWCVVGAAAIITVAFVILVWQNSSVRHEAENRVHRAFIS